MRLRYYGHSSFLLEAADGTRVIVDPYESGAFNGAIKHSPITDTADAVVASHKHDDHGAVDTIPGHPQVFVHPTAATVGAWKITGIDVAHDAEGGRSRGKNTIIVLDDGDVRLVHLGDLGHMLTPETVAAIGPVDVLMIPVGGYFTIDHARGGGSRGGSFAADRHPHALQDSQGGLPHLWSGTVPGHAGHRRAPGHVHDRDHSEHAAGRTGDLPPPARQIGR